MTLKNYVESALQSWLFFIFAALMVVDMGILALMAIKYKYVDYTGKNQMSDDAKTD